MEIQKLFVSLLLDAAEYTDGLGDAQKEASSFSERLQNVIGTGFQIAQATAVAAATAIAAAVVGIGLAAFGVSNDVATATSNIQAELGTTAEEAEHLGQIATDVWGNNFAGSITEAAGAVGLIRQQLGELSDNELQRATENAFRLQDVFGVEVPESVDAAKTLMEQFGLTSEEAFDFIAKGFQNGLNRSDDFLDTIGEYSVQFAAGGADAGQFFSLLESGLQGGMLGTDKAADAFKEFRLRILDGSDATFEATASLFGFSGGVIDNTAAMGGMNESLLKNQVALERLTNKQANYSDSVSEAQRALDSLQIAELTAEIASQEAALGNLAAQNGQYVEGVEGLIDFEGGVEGFFAALSDGSLSGADAFQLVVDALGGIEDPAERMQVATALLGTQFEDLGDSAALGMSLAGTSLEDMAGAVGSLDAKYNTLGSAVEGFKRRGLLALQPIGDILLNLANSVMPIVDGAFAFFETTIAPAIENVAGVIQRLIDNISNGMSPINAISGALAELFGPEVSEAFINIVIGIEEFIAKAQEVLTPIVTWVQQNVELKDVLIAFGLLLASVILPILGSLLLSILAIAAPIVAAIAIVALLRTAWEQNWGGIQEKTAAAVEFIRGVITAVMAGVQAFWAANGEAIMAKAQEIWTGIQTAVNTAITTIQTIITTIATAIQTFWQQHGETIMEAAAAAWEFISTAVETALSVIDSVWQAFKSAFEGDWTGFGENLRDAWDTAWEFIKTTFTNAKETIIGIAAGLVLDLIAKFQNTDWKAVGTAIIQGIANGISAGAGAIADAARAAAQAALDAAKAFLGIQSPSKVAALQIGEPFTEGLALGLGDVAPIRNSVADLVNEMTLPFAQPVISAETAVTALPSPAPDSGRGGEGDTYIFNIDAPGGDVDAIEKAVERAMAKSGRKADTRIRTR